jgi:hypothetical protein
MGPILAFTVVAFFIAVVSYRRRLD